MNIISKNLEGKEVYLLPTGNLARRNKEVRTLPVVKVARVFVTLLQYGREYKYRYDGNILSDGHNGGYVLFEDMNSLVSYEERMKLAQSLSIRANSFRFRDLSISDLKKIEEIFNSRMEKIK